MLKGSRDASLKSIQPISVHGQVSWEITFVHLDDPESAVHAARVGPEAVVGHSLDAGDAVRLEYLVGQVVKVTRLANVEVAGR